jgi:hypothetical protein
MSFNIIEGIKSQLGGDTLAQLSSVIGENQDKTKNALGASLPALLGSLTGLASRPEGASQLFSTSRDEISFSKPDGSLYLG